VRLELSTFLTLALATVGAACDAAPAVRSARATQVSAGVDSAVMLARQDSVVRSRPGHIIDSILPVEEEIRRFREATGETRTAFAGGAGSRAALIRAFVRALEQRDTTALAGLVVDRAEFGWLIYPTSPNARPPYRQAPEIVWLQRSAATAKGTRRLLDRFGGRALPYRGVTCSADEAREGENSVWAECAVRLVGSAPADTTTLRMFGPIVRHGSRFKFLSLATGM